MSDARAEIAKTMGVDGAKASPLVGYWVAVLSGMSLADWATLAAFAYSVLLIVDKLKQMGVFRFVLRQAGRFVR